jgi:peptide/nickel transport system permease protein
MAICIRNLLVGISFVLGAVIGAFCGYAGGRLDRTVGRFVDVVMAFPLFVLAMAMVAALGNRVENIVIATAVINLPFYIRFARAEVNVRRNVGWVEAARASGESHMSVVLRFLLPNAAGHGQAMSLNLGWAILNAAGLSFIGLGVKPPTRNGASRRAGRTLHPHRSMVAGGLPAALMMAVLCFNLLGDGCGTFSILACGHDRTAAANRRLHDVRHAEVWSKPCGARFAR